MSLENKLNNIIKVKDDLAKVIENKGTSVEETDTFRSYATKINEMSVRNTPAGPSGKGLILWMDAKENGPNGTHTSEQKSPWYTLRGLNFNQDSTATMDSNLSYFNCQDSNYPGIEWASDHVKFKEGHKGYFPNSYSKNNVTAENSRYYVKFPSSPVGFTIESVFSLSEPEASLSDAEVTVISCQETGGVALFARVSTEKIGIQPYFTFTDGTSGYNGIYIGGMFEYNVRYYCVSGFDSVSGKYFMRLLNTVTGVESYKESTKLGWTLTNFDKTPIVVGYNPGTTGTGTSDFFRGTLSSVRVYKRCLTEEELVDNFLYEKNRYNF